MTVPIDHVLMMRDGKAAHVHDSEQRLWEGQGWELVKDATPEPDAPAKPRGRPRKAAA
ncbi:MAG: hypothetical protein WD688_08455 [Candidatus Binatia bacterium]